MRWKPCCTRCRKKERVVGDVVLDHEQHGNVHAPGVVQDVALVFDVADDRNQDARVALPQEDAVDVGVRIAGDKVLDLAIVVRQHNYRNIESGSPQLARQLRRVHVADVQVSDDQVEARLRQR